MTRPLLIGLYSPYPGCGKSAVASHLQTYHGYNIVSFATPLKHLTIHFLRYLGYDNAAATRLVYHAKEELIPELGVSCRHLQRTLGTEWGRTCVSPTVWIQCWSVQAHEYLQQDRPVVVDDVRFPNEAEAVTSLGGALWRIDRPNSNPDISHASDGACNDFSFSHTINNTFSDLAQLYAHIDALLLLCPDLADAA